MHIDVIRSEDEFFALREAWTKIFHVAATNHPFSSFDWAAAWWQTMLPTSRWQKHEMHIVAMYSMGELVAIAPLFLTTYGSWFFGGIRYLRPIGSDKNTTELRSLVIKPGHEAAASQALAQYIHSNRQAFDFVKWPDQIVTPSTDSGLTDTTTVENFILPLGSSWEEFKSSRKRNIKESIRKCYNAPARNGIHLSFEAVEDQAAILQLLPDFYRLHGQRAAGNTDAVHLDYFSSDQSRRFLSTLVAGLACVTPILFIVRHDQKIIAARLAFAMNSSLYLYYSGFDLSYGDYSVTTRLVVEAMQYAIARNLPLLNLSIGNDLSKTRWSPEVVTYQNTRTISANLRTRCMAPIIKRTAAYDNYRQTPASTLLSAENAG